MSGIGRRIGGTRTKRKLREGASVIGRDDRVLYLMADTIESATL